MFIPAADQKYKIKIGSVNKSTCSNYIHYLFIWLTTKKNAKAVQMHGAFTMKTSSNYSFNPINSPKTKDI